MNPNPLLPGVNPYETMDFHVIGPHSSFSRALRLLKSLKRNVRIPHVLGFGCFWASEDQVADSIKNLNHPPGARRRVSVVTLASSNGRVLVIRLLNILQIQNKSSACRRFLRTLKKLLASTNVPKVGFALKRDALYIMDDYKNEDFEHQFRLNGFLENSIFKSIEKLSHQSIDYFANLIFGVRFDTKCSRNDWEAPGKYLPPELVAHAAKDATLAIQVFMYFVQKQFPPDLLNELNGRKLCKKIGGSEFIGRYKIKRFPPRLSNGYK